MMIDTCAKVAATPLGLPSCCQANPPHPSNLPRIQMNNLPSPRMGELAWRALLGLLLFPALLTAGTGALTNPPPATVTLHDFNLIGDLRGDRALFTLTA